MSKVLAMDPTVEFWWEPKCEKDSAEGTKFRLKYKNLRAREEAEITDKQVKTFTDNSKGKKNISEYSIRVQTADLQRCKLSIKGWENFSYPENHPTKPSEEVPFSVENIEMIPSNIRSEFVTFITKRDEISEDEEGEDLGEAT